ncbi:armadillo-type protein [Dimargaris cristalligena]|uniref:Armadillo-type protein n=1 Tax=Dimargaris cristalligena TaxID=215637 RepID=A0A4P9ZMK6_9FUNG|nr:armadillo-type protein [Dimargaris cristalligena]|eukprot:RKP34517.1 armadillo-type protein [Dimargaris cristalligena]
MADFGFDFTDEEYDEPMIASSENVRNSDGQPSDNSPVDARSITVASDATPSPTSLASLSSEVLVDSIEDASPKVLEAVLPNQFDKGELTPIDRLCIRSQSSLPFLRVWAAREIKNVLHSSPVADILTTIFPVAFQLSMDKVEPDNASPTNGSLENPITHPLFHDWLETMLLDPSPVVVNRVQAALIELGHHMEFDLYHTEVIHHTVLGLVKSVIKSRPPSIDKMAGNPLSVAFLNSNSEWDGRTLRRKLVALKLIRALVQEFGSGLKPAVFVPTIEKTSHDPSFEVRRDTAFTLGELSYALSYDLVLEGVFPIFQHLIQDTNWQVRQAAALTALPKLATVLTSPHRASPQITVGPGQTLHTGPNGPSHPGNASFPAGQSPHLPPPAPPVAAKVWVQIIDRLLGSREVSYPVQTSVFEVIGQLMVAFQHMDKVKEILIRHYLSVVESAVDQDVVTTPELIFQCAYNFPAMLFIMGVSRWDELADAYMALTRFDHFEARKTLAHSLHEVAKLLGPEFGEQYHEKVFGYFLVDLDEIQLAVVAHLTDFLDCLYPVARERCLPQILEVFQHEGNNWRARETMARQLAPLCRLYPERTVVRHLLPLTVYWARDQVAAVRAAAASAFPVIFDMTKEDPGLQVQFFESIIQFRAATTFRARLFFIQICEALLTQQVDATDFEQFFLPSLLALANDKVSNVRIAVARTLKRLLPAQAAMSAEPTEDTKSSSSSTQSSPRSSASSQDRPSAADSGALGPHSSETNPVSVDDTTPTPASSTESASETIEDLLPDEAEVPDTTASTELDRVAPVVESSAQPNEPVTTYHWTDTRSQLITDLINILRADTDRDVLAIIATLPKQIVNIPIPREPELPTAKIPWLGVQSSKVEGSADFPNQSEKATTPDAVASSETADPSITAVFGGMVISAGDVNSPANPVPHRSNSLQLDFPVEATDVGEIRRSSSLVDFKNIPGHQSNVPSTPAPVSAEAIANTVATEPSPVTAQTVAEPTSRGAIDIIRPTFSFPSFTFKRKQSVGKAINHPGPNATSQEVGSDSPAATPASLVSYTIASFATSSAQDKLAPSSGADSANASPGPSPPTKPTSTAGRLSQSLLSRFSSFPSLLENPLADVKFSSALVKNRNQPAPSNLDPADHTLLQTPSPHPAVIGTSLLTTATGTTNLGIGTTSILTSHPLPRITRTPSPPMASAAVFSSDRRVRRIHSHPTNLLGHAERDIPTFNTKGLDLLANGLPRALEPAVLLSPSKAGTGDMTGHDHTGAGLAIIRPANLPLVTGRSVSMSGLSSVLANVNVNGGENRGKVTNGIGTDSSDSNGNSSSSRGSGSMIVDRLFSSKFFS